MEARPIQGWLIVSNVLIYGYLIVIALWAVNFIFDNKGGTIHLAWLFFSLGTYIPLLVVYVASLAGYLSYPTRTNVYMTWFGGTLTISNGVYTISKASSTWKSDRLYLMWKNSNAVNIP